MGEIISKDIGPIHAAVGISKGKLVSSQEVDLKNIVEELFAAAAKLIPGDSDAEKVVLGTAKGLVLAALAAAE